MSDQDVSLKSFFEKNAYFVDMFNAYFFNGKQVLKKEHLKPMDSEMHDERLNLTKHVDVIRKYHDQDILSVFILENQSTIDYSMVIRSAYYEFLTYDRMLKQAKKNKRYRKDTRFPMVYVLVFYTGEQAWNAARKLSEIVRVDERFKALFHEYEMNMIEINSDKIYNFNEKDIKDLVYISRAIFNQSVHQKGMLKSFGKVKLNVARLIEKITDIQWVQNEKEGEIDMCEAERAWEASKIEQGRLQGLEQGISQGEQETKRNMYKTMLDKGFTIEQIANIFVVSIESIEKLIY